MPRPHRDRPIAKVFGAAGTTEPLDTEQMDDIVKGIPMQRVGTPEEIAGLVAFLASPTRRTSPAAFSMSMAAGVRV